MSDEAASNLTNAAKRFCLDFIDRNEEAFITLNDSIFYFGELGMQEFRSAQLMTSILERHGFCVERGISGFETSFLATYGKGAPVVAIHTEYDANPSNSQKPGIVTRTEIVPGAPGHCEGHNTNAAVMVASALAIRHAMEKFGLRGTLKIFGASAEEQLLSRPYFVRDGLFDDVDLAFHDHILDRFGTDYGLIQSAAVSADFSFSGESAHAAVSPWKARDALDAVVLMDVGMAQYREHMRPTMTAHRVITQGGEQPNVIPASASCWWYFRDPTADGARTLFERAQKIAQGAALMANCELKVDVRAAVWPVRLNRVIAEVIQSNAELAGMPVWTDEENAFARALQQQAQVPEIGLRAAITPLTGPATQIAASNDCGDVSWKVPMGRVWFPGNVPNLPFHHWSAGAPLTTSIAHKGGIAGAKALAGSVVDFLLDSALVTKAKECFVAELDGVTYFPLLPDNQKPPANLNHELMEKYRAAMEPYYVKSDPIFEI
jgi:aminobenzoyl-glutamate utilization protein B